MLKITAHISSGLFESVLLYINMDTEEVAVFWIEKVTHIMFIYQKDGGILKGQLYGCSRMIGKHKRAM